ncbi:LGFP repeat-containing protein [Rhodococcus sp. NBC_00294]|uniref:LGFP repeat-containing protein n=1 Tax=Rhodococcus sp. NBC_00294 TaxID=2976004 RepID=UPI002E2CC28E|nr:hypothetical protein [Rhodococcus sp. NBC_00294]
MTTTRTSTRRSTGLRVRFTAVSVLGAALALAGAGQAMAQPASAAPQATAAATCQSFWPTPYPVCGEILDLYTSLGGPTGTLSYPQGPEAPAGDGIGTRQAFLGGSVYYSPTTGAYVE